MLYILGFALWLALAIVIATGARNRNRSYWGYLVLSILLSPFIAFIVLITLGEKKKTL